MVTVISTWLLSGVDCRHGKKKPALTDLLGNGKGTAVSHIEVQHFVEASVPPDLLHLWTLSLRRHITRLPALTVTDALVFHERTGSKLMYTDKCQTVSEACVRLNAM